MTLTAAEALKHSAAHVAELYGRCDAEPVRDQLLDSVTDGWVDGAYRTSDEPVWSVRIQGRGEQIGARRFVCVSKWTGTVLFDGRVGE